MRGNPERFQIVAVDSLDHALQKLASEPGRWTPFAGGTDLMVVYDTGKMASADFLDLHKIRELASITVQGDELVIGAMATYQQIKSHPLITSAFPNLIAAARQTGSIAIQNRGTIGGNIANASPAADTPPALLSYRAVIEVVGKGGTRLIPYGQFHQSYKKTALQPGELICRIRLPLKISYTKHYYRKVGTRNAQAISKVVMAATASLQNGVVDSMSVALGSVGPTVIYCHELERQLVGKRLNRDSIAFAIGTLHQDISPIDDIRSTVGYRQTVAENLLAEFLSSIL